MVRNSLTVHAAISAWSVLSEQYTHHLCNNLVQQGIIAEFVHVNGTYDCFEIPLGVIFDTL